ncbi:MAG: hypothetical protein CMM49_00455 [Rhodospirillaceae bacterium]|nr:hypothetical protein [Rhodospirillaceae bacterium]|tara:strand:- start:21305 stop:24412 length:3108 start_codon:yes stop_codon:yes gene_type:complete
MLSKISKYIFAVISSIILVILIVLVFLFFRLQQGPISITFLTPYVQEAIQLNPDLQLDITVEDCLLKWRSFDKGFDISLIGGKVKKRNNDIIASIPEMFISFDIDKILELKLKLKSIEINGPSLTIERNKSGKFDFGIGEHRQDKEIVRKLKKVLFEDILRDKVYDLEKIEIFNAKIYYDDKLKSKKITSKDTDIIITKNKSDIDSVFMFTIENQTKDIPIKISSLYNMKSEFFDIGINFSNFSTSLITPFFDQLNPLNRITSPLDGGLSFKIDQKGLLQNLGFNFFSVNEGELNLNPLINKNIYVDFIQASGEIDKNLDKVYFNDLYISSKTAKFEASGVISNIDGGTIRLNGKVRDWHNNDLKRLWPDNILPPVRSWYVSSIEDGKITDGDVVLDLTYNQIQKKQLTNESVFAKLNVSGVKLNYLSSFPNLNEASGFIEITPKKLISTLETGKIEGIDLSEGKIELKLKSPKQWFAELEFVGKGTNKDIFKVLNNDPINVSEKFYINQENIFGTSASRVILNFPVRLDLKFNEVNFAAITNLVNFGINDIIKDINLSNGNMLLNITKNNLKVTGKGEINNIPINIDWDQNLLAKEGALVKINGVISSTNSSFKDIDYLNFIEGDIPFDFKGRISGNKINTADIFMDLTNSKIILDYINYIKDYKEEATVKFRYKNNNNEILIENIRYKSKKLKLLGDVEFDSSLEIKRVDIEKFISPSNDFSFSVRKKRPNGYLIAVNGDKLYVENYVKKFLDSNLKLNFPEMKIFIQVNQMQFTKKQYLTDSKTEIEYNGKSIRSLKSTGKLNGEGYIIAKIISKNDNDKSFLLHTKNAGSMAKSTGFFDDAKGGNLLVYAKINDSKTEPLLEGKIILENIRLIKVPLLARILSLASLTGIIEIFSGEGILFVKGDIPFNYKSGVLFLDDARVYGPSLGMRLDGNFNNKEDIIDVSGTIIPAYTINSILGQIPLLGSLLVGQKKEGVFAVSYQIKGNKNSPYVGINPLLSLSPGFIRDFFSVFKAGPTPPTLEELEIRGLPD